MSQNCVHDHHRTETGVMSANEQVFLHNVKAGLVEAINAYKADDEYFNEYFSMMISSEKVVIKKPYKWFPWMKLVYTIPECGQMQCIIEIYNDGEFVFDEGDKDHFVIHASFTNEWVKHEAIKFMSDHGYSPTEHSHPVSTVIPSDWACGFLAFEPSS
jgi:hypothetical protein